MMFLTSRPAERSGPLPDPSAVEILVTVGTELPFDRLVSTVERWATEQGRAGSVLAQVGETEHPPTQIAWTRFLDGPEFRQYFASAKLIVSHAGMGTIIAALHDQRPLVVMPRRYRLGEHRNDHQMATATRLAELDRADVAFDEEQLVERLDDRRVSPKSPIGPYAEESLLRALRLAVLAPGAPISSPSELAVLRLDPSGSSRREARSRNRRAE